MTKHKPIEWIADGEKYALVGLQVNIEPQIPIREVAPRLWAWTDQALSVPTLWREWLGSIRTEEIEGCNLVLLSKLQSQAPRVLDAENQQLQHLVSGFYFGLMLSTLFAAAQKPIALTGVRVGDEIDVRQGSDFDTPLASLLMPYPMVTAKHIERAAKLSVCYRQLVTSPPAGGAWRLFRALTVYFDGRTTSDILDRLHQYCRCIDGLIQSDPGKGLRQFESRTELFVGPQHHKLMGELYAIRSDAEHLQEHKYLETYDREIRIDLAMKEAKAEHIARNALAHIIETPTLWPHFGNTAALAKFWQLPTADQQMLWGKALSKPDDALTGFNPKYVSDSSLGK